MQECFTRVVGKASSRINSALHGDVFGSYARVPDGHISGPRKTRTPQEGENGDRDRDRLRIRIQRCGMKRFRKRWCLKTWHGVGLRGVRSNTSRVGRPRTRITSRPSRLKSTNDVHEEVRRNLERFVNAQAIEISRGQMLNIVRRMCPLSFPPLHTRGREHESDERLVCP